MNGLSLAYTNVVTRRRDDKGNPLPRHYVFAPPLVCLDPEALIETAEAFRESPEAGRRHYVWLKARNAVAASENFQFVRAEVWERIRRTNTEVQERLSQLRPELVEAEKRERDLAAPLAPALAELGTGYRLEGPELEFAEDAPSSLSALAGRHGLPSPEQKPSWMHRSGYRLLSVLGGGTIFGISLGLLTGKLELARLDQDWPWLFFWSGIGMTVLALISSIFTPVSQSVGRQLYQLGCQFNWLRLARPILDLMFLALVAIAVIRIESSVEQLGLFKAVSEQTSLHGVKLSPLDLSWVSLLLVVPAVLSSIVLGLREGERSANLDRLQSLREDERSLLRSSPEFVLAAQLQRHYHFASAERVRLEAEVQAQTARHQDDLNESERERLEDAEMEVAGHSLAVEELMRESPSIVPESFRKTLPTLIGQLFGRSRFRGASR